MTKAIGGYFELELPLCEEYHKNAIRLNTGRNCLEYILRAKGYKKLYIPYYTCGVILKPINKLGTRYEFYHINSQFEICNLPTLKDDEALLYTNYFAMKQAYVEFLAGKFGSRLIVDDTQAFYAEPIMGLDTFFTCRKFFGVADGAYLYTDTLMDKDFGQDVSYDRMNHLLKRIDLSAEQGFSDFRAADDGLDNLPIREMSKLTRRIMQSVDYEAIARKRRANFQILGDALSGLNGLNLHGGEEAVPMVYPFLSLGKGLRDKLIENKIFVARYWPNVLDWCRPSDWEYQLAENMVCLPIDQRYDAHDMNRIIKIIIDGK